MNAYQKGKEAARAAAIEWQNDFIYQCYSYGELYEAQCFFSALAKRFGLIKEFRENGII